MAGLGGILGGIGKKLAPFLNQMGEDGEDGGFTPLPKPNTLGGRGIIPKLAMPEGDGAMPPSARQMPPITGLNMPARNESPLDQAATIGTNMPPALPASGVIPQMAMPKMMEPQAISDDGVPVPALPGRKEPTRGPFAKERFGYVYGRQPKDEETGIERKHTFKERLKSGILPALLGAVQGAAATPGNPLGGLLGGAATGFGAGAISPTLGREYEFDTMHMPSLIAEENRNRDLSLDDYRRQKQGLDIEGQRADIEGTRARTAATQAGMKDAGIEREYRVAQIKKLEAEAQARQTGKPQLYDAYDPETGQIRKMAVYPDGRQVGLDASGNAQLKREGYMNQSGIAEGNRESREGIASADRASREQIAYDKMNAQPQMSRDAREAYSDYLDNKRAAEQAWAAAKRETDPQKKKELEQAARDAQEMFNYQTQSLGQLYPDLFESGMGQGNWAYAKPKGGSRPQSSPTGGTTAVSSAAVEGYAKEKGISYDEALKRFQAKGIQVRK